MKKFIVLIVLLAAAGGVIYGWKSRPAGPAASKSASDTLYYTCVMHPFIHRDEPGKCPICSMDLVPVKKDKVQAQTAASAGAAGPDALEGLAPVKLTPFKEQMIGVRLAPVRAAQVVRDIRTVGRFAGGAGNFAATSADFTGRGTVKSGGGAYVVADVYALDQPFVKAGQKAWVSPFSHPELKVEGRVARFYPYDGTQSRVMRVRIDLKASLTQEVFANVQIEATVPARMAVPRDAVLHTGTQAYVFVERSPGEFGATPVVVGFQGDDLCEIASGLKAGDQVAWGGNFMLDADAHINATSPEAKQ